MYEFSTFQIYWNFILLPFQKRLLIFIKAMWLKQKQIEYEVLAFGKSNVKNKMNLSALTV